MSGKLASHARSGVLADRPELDQAIVVIHQPQPDHSLWQLVMAFQCTAMWARFVMVATQLRPEKGKLRLSALLSALRSSAEFAVPHDSGFYVLGTVAETRLVSEPRRIPSEDS